MFCTIFGYWAGGGGGGAPRGLVHNRLMQFFTLHKAEKVFPGPDSMGSVWGGVGRALMQFMHFSAIFAMVAVLATSVTPWYPL